MKAKAYKKQKGFTIVEILMAVSIMTVVALGSATLISNFSAQNKKMQGVQTRDLLFNIISVLVRNPVAIN
ncbi:MAG: prepilin-type N-terminal cleavage/methylation domain-containing protein, partial [Deltaproteobacteria bacterium]|nr:prepilin-type N-terminal cleavage/methylation domain-containing protein [Deltaproteobacteria bacterium]